MVILFPFLLKFFNIIMRWNWVHSKRYYDWTITFGSLVTKSWLAQDFRFLAMLKWYGREKWIAWQFYSIWKLSALVYTMEKSQRHSLCLHVCDDYKKVKLKSNKCFKVKMLGVWTRFFYRGQYCYKITWRLRNLKLYEGNFDHAMSQLCIWRE